MKQALKRIIPDSFLRIITHLSRKQRIMPLVTSYRGDNSSVLQCCVSYNKYGGYCVPLSSLYRPAAQTILSGGVWEIETIEFMIRNSAGGDIVHAGTYFGDFIPALSMSCANGARIVAFEPNPENFRCALVTIAINALKNVEIMNAGLGAEKGTLPMMTYDENGRSLGGASHIDGAQSDNQNSRYVEVEIVRLDDVVTPDRKVSIIQLDVEGFEQPALEGAMSTIRRCKPILILETPPGEGWMDERIYGLGYRKTGVVRDNTILTVNR